MFYNAELGAGVVLHTCAQRTLAEVPWAVHRPIAGISFSQLLYLYMIILKWITALLKAMLTHPLTHVARQRHKKKYR